MLYRIEGANVKIAGAAHAFTLDKPQVPQWLRYVFNESDKWVFETDRVGHDPEAALLPAHQSLSVLTFFGRVTALWNQLQIPGRAGRHKPWAAHALLVRHLAKLLSPGVAELMLSDAAERAHPSQFLETSQERVAAFDAVSLQEQLDQLEDAATHPAEAATREIARHEAELAGNVKVLGEMVDAQRKAFPESVACGLDGRNKNWLPRLTQIIRDNAADHRLPKTVIAMEAAHLVGEGSVLKLLGQEGYAVTRLL